MGEFVHWRSVSDPRLNQASIQQLFNGAVITENVRGNAPVRILPLGPQQRRELSLSELHASQPSFLNKTLMGVNWRSIPA
jgi:hypothetical protein